MKLRFMGILSAVIIISTNAYGAVILDEDFSSYSEGATYGAIPGFKNDFQTLIPIAGGKIESVNGNKMVMLQGSYPKLDTKFAVAFNTSGYILDYIKFDFFMQYDPLVQQSLDWPTTLTAEIYRLDSTGKLITPESIGKINLLYFQYTGIITDDLDITPNPSSFASPFNSNYSLSNMASYTADVSGLNGSVTSSMLLVFSMVYPDFYDPYNPETNLYTTTGYIDNIEIGGHNPVPEPSMWGILVFGVMFLKRLIRK